MTTVPQYPKRDLRRMLMVLGAIDSLKPAKLVKVSAMTGLDKKTVTTLIALAQEQAGVEIEKTDAPCTQSPTGGQSSSGQAAAWRWPAALLESRAGYP